MDQQPKTHANQNRKHPLPSIDSLRQRFSYDPETGIISKPDGTPTGRKTRHGYVHIWISEKPTMHAPRSRLAFALTTGRWPEVIDHINRDKADDRWTNLRECTQRENTTNRAATHIHKRANADYAQGFSWQAQVIRQEGRQTTQRRDFCSAWQARQRMLSAPKPTTPRTTPRPRVDRDDHLKMAEKIAAAVQMLTALTGQLLKPDDSTTADETTARLAAAASLTRSLHHAAIALEMIQRNDAEGEALEASLQAKAAREQARPLR